MGLSQEFLSYWLKKCPRIKIFRKFLSHGIKFFVLGQNISEKFCPTQIKFVLPHNFQKRPGRDKRQVETAVTVETARGDSSDGRDNSDS